MAPTLYWMSGSGHCWKAMIVLEECGVPYEGKMLEMSKGETKTPEMLALNPRGQLPVFVDGDKVISESLAICLYAICEHGKGKLIHCGEPTTKALVLQRFMAFA